MALDRARAREFLTRAGLGVVSSVGPDGAPESALVNIAVGEDLEIIFETIQTTRKCQNLRRDPRASVLAWMENETLQCQGNARELDADADDALLQVYFNARAQARAHRGWPGLTYFRIRPHWLRLSRYYGTTWSVDELALRI